jgi:ATP-dependent Lon protease
MAERFTLPVLPLRDTVVYPGVAVPISAGRPGTVEAVQEALDGDRRLFAVAQKENVDDPSPDILYSVGTVVRIIQTHRVRGGVQLLVQGEGRAQALNYQKEGEAMLTASLLAMDRIPPQKLQDPAFQALDRELRERAAELATRRGVPAEALNQLIHGMDDPGAFADLVAFYLELPTGEKQKLLEILDDEERMRRTLVSVERELARIEAQEDIQARVQEELGERQREMLLREQLKQIQKELGDEDDRSDVEELRKRVEELVLGEDARTEVERELKRLERTSPQSAEYQVIRTFLEWVTELPWGDRTEDRIDLARSEEILEEDHYGLEDVKDRVLEFLAVRKLQMERALEEEGVGGRAEAQEEATADGDDGPDGEEAGDRRGPNGNGAPNGNPATASPGTGSRRPAAEKEALEAAARAVGRGPILLFVGPPGVGKTSIAQSVARSLGRKYVRISLGGARDEADIRGHRRTYVGAMPGRIIQGMRQVKSKNPVFLLDEVDKLGTFRSRGTRRRRSWRCWTRPRTPASPTTTWGSPSTCRRCSSSPRPTTWTGFRPPSWTGWSGWISPATPSRRSWRSPSGTSCPVSGRRTVSGRTSCGWTTRRSSRSCSSTPGRPGSGSSSGSWGRWGGRWPGRSRPEPPPRCWWATRRSGTSWVGPGCIPERMAPEDTVGVATGMFYTPMGGDIMFVEASVMPGEGLVLTGQLGDVMKESGRAALSYAKSHHGVLGITEESLKGKEVHIHVPAGAVPKDGPSAGITMATALVSALSGRKVRRDVAMTGELTLTGRVLPIGGVKEKLLGAIRAGIKEIILPHDNEADLEDLQGGAPKRGSGRRRTAEAAAGG